MNKRPALTQAFYFELQQGLRLSRPCTIAIPQFKCATQQALPQGTNDGLKNLTSASDSTAIVLKIFASRDHRP